MKKYVTLTAIGTAVTAAAIAGGAGVALAHGDHGDMGDHTSMMTAATMQMDPATMQEHMRQVLGDDAYQKMQEAMKQALGEDGYQKMLQQMSSACSENAGSMMSGGAAGATMPGHAAHHTPTPASN